MPRGGTLLILEECELVGGTGFNIYASAMVFSSLPIMAITYAAPR
eukprot:CAMPEP_0196199228 /NCGR_PEP_ID=MMETSP0912-20130531/2986_1 /TAXON_ID=49265 /ORGANISM="Thalassiosira rotula, Strain GSO102" /LENGTH=44 /DNA_ID= /DNA_START= /DNA_END= /DNA_ORIENTATION=